MIFDNEIPSIIFENGMKRTFIKDSNIYKINSSVTHCYFLLSGTV